MPLTYPKTILCCEEDFYPAKVKKENFWVLQQGHASRRSGTHLCDQNYERAKKIFTMKAGSLEGR